MKQSVIKHCNVLNSALLNYRGTISWLSTIYNIFSLFIETSRVKPSVSNHFNTAISIHPYEDIVDFLKTTCNTGKTWLAANSSHGIVSAIERVR